MKEDTFKQYGFSDWKKVAESEVNFKAHLLMLLSIIVDRLRMIEMWATKSFME